MAKRTVLALLVMGCGGGGDSTPAPDAPAIPATLTITGKAEAYTQTGTKVLEGVRIGAYYSSDEATEVLYTMTDANGDYSMVVPTGGVPIDGFFKASLQGYMDTYLYAPGLIVEDFPSARVAMLAPDTFTTLADTLCGANQQATNAAIIAIVADANTDPMAGATVGSAPAASKYCYNAVGIPNRTATATDTDGIAYYLNVPAGRVTVNAVKPGVPLPSHAVIARAGVLTTTLIVP
jgi:hypothetical protein